MIDAAATAAHQTYRKCRWWVCTAENAKGCKFEAI